MSERVHLVLALTAIAGLAFGYAHLAERRGYELPAGQPAPPLDLPHLDGGRMRLADLRGQTVVLNFWATWCPPCVAEMPSLQRMQETLAGEGIKVVTVAQDEDQDALRKFVAASHLGLPVLLDPGGAVGYREFRITGVPETFVIDPSGVVRNHVVGAAEWDSPGVVSEIRSFAAPAQR